MPVFKNEDNGTWYVMARYVNWKGERKQKCKAEDYQWKELAEKLNDENRLLQRQNEELLNCRTD